MAGAPNEVIRIKTKQPHKFLPLRLFDFADKTQAQWHVGKRPSFLYNVSPCKSTAKSWQQRSYTVCLRVRAQLEVDNRDLFSWFLEHFIPLPLILFSGRHDFSCVCLNYCVVSVSFPYDSPESAVFTVVCAFLSCWLGFVISRLQISLSQGLACCCCCFPCCEWCLSLSSAGTPRGLGDCQLWKLEKSCRVLMLIG